MTEATPRLDLPYLAPGQAQKEATHNEVLAIVDALIHPAPQAVRNDPPAVPAIGAAWIVGRAPTGAWTGRADAIAWWSEGGWRFGRAIEGMTAWLADAGETARFTSGAWAIAQLPARALLIGGQNVVGPRQPAIDAPAGGATVDSQARATLASILVALKTHGLIAS
ncbi:MAG: DUF2793 domain-containing protein [Sphingomonas fennica]